MPTGVYERTDYHIQRLSSAKKGIKPKNYEIFRQSSIGPRVLEKACNRCHVVKPRSAFLGKYGTRKSLATVCSDCINAHAKEYRDKYRSEHPEKYAKTKRTANLKKFGMTIEEYETM